MTEGQKGNAFIIFGGLIWSLFPVVTVLGLKGMSSMTSLFWAILFSVFFFFAVLAFRKRWSELKNLQAWKYCLGIAIFNGVLYYGLYFYGLTKTVSANGAIVALFEVVTSYIYFQIIHQEKIPKKQLWGIILAACGALLIFIPKFGHFYKGDLFILAATFFAPFGNKYSQQARKLVSSEALMFMRNLLTVPFLFLLLMLIGVSSFSLPLGNAFWWLLLNGVLVLGLSKIFWMEGIHRMTVTRALAIGSLSPIFTIFFAWLLIGNSPSLSQLFALPILVAGVFLLTNFNFRRIRSFNKRVASLK